MKEYFSNIKDILKDIKLPYANPVYGQVISEWSSIVGKRFAAKSEVNNFVQKGTKLFLYVDVVSSPIAQELMFFKLNLIRKIKNSYNLEISDIIIKVAQKSNNEVNKVKPNLVEEVYDLKPSKEELEQIKLKDEDIEKIITSVNSQRSLDEKKRERMINIIISDLKTQEWMKQKGFPVCKKCGCVMTKKTFGEDNICRFCKKETQ